MRIFVSRATRTRTRASAVVGLALACGITLPASQASTVDATPATAAQPAAKPTIVLVHGAFAGTSSWSGEVEILRQQGYDVRAIANPLDGLTSDAETVASFLKTIAGPVILVGHSYGGSVITNAAAQVNNVRGLVYVDAAAPAPGETTGSLSGSTSALNAPADTLFESVGYPNAPAGAMDLYLKKDIFLNRFGQNLPASRATDLWATQRPASTAAFDTPSQYAAWQTIPSWYFISTGDQIITQQSEEMMAQRAGSRVTLFEGGSHLTLVSNPDAVANVILDAARTVG